MEKIIQIPSLNRFVENQAIGCKLFPAGYLGLENVIANKRNQPNRSLRPLQMRLPVTVSTYENRYLEL